jgi:peptide/nickel transport system substrate-binding protein
MQRLSARLAALAALVLALSACSVGDDEGGSGPRGEGPGATSALAYPELRVAYDNGIDYLDPGLSYTVQGWTIMLNTHLGLLTYKQVAGPEGAELIPALADDLPEVSGDGLRYSFRLREGLTYSNGRELKASDFESSIKRLFLLDSPGVGFFTGIEGAAAFARTEKGDISGIVTDDEERTIEIRLTAPQGDFMHVLAMLFASFVPAGTPGEDRSVARVPGVGPYMVETYEPNRLVKLVRNPEWKGIEGIPNGNPDAMTFNVVATDEAALQSVLDGDNDYDFHPIPVDRLPAIRQEHGDRLRVYTPANTYYFFLNTRVPPFDKLEVRQAVNHAIDREAVARLYGGLATPTENVLPPTYPQYEEHTLYPYDLERAKRLVRASGYAGMNVTVWGNSRETLQKPAEYYARVLNEIGFRARTKIIDPSVYFGEIGSQRTRAQTGIANWFQDYPHPLNWFDTLLNGRSITRENNNNYSNANVPEINRRIAELKAEPEMTEEVVEGWKELDRLVAEHALWAPVVNRTFTDFFSEELDLERCYVNHVLYQFLYAASCRKEG